MSFPMPSQPGRSGPSGQQLLFSQLASDFRRLRGTSGRMNFVRNRILSQAIAAEFLKQGVSKQGLIQKMLAERITDENLAFESLASENVTSPPAIKILLNKIQNPQLLQNLFAAVSRAARFGMLELMAEGPSNSCNADLIEEFFKSAETLSAYLYDLPITNIDSHPEEVYIVRLFFQNFKRLPKHLQEEVANDPRCDSPIARELLAFNVPYHLVQSVLVSKLAPNDAFTIGNDHDASKDLYPDCKRAVDLRAREI